MADKNRRACLNIEDALALLMNGNDSDFGDDDADTDTEEDDDYVIVQPDQSDKNDLSANNSSDEDFSEEDDEPLSTFSTSKKGKGQQKRKYKWRKKDFEPPDITFTGTPLSQPTLDDKGQLQSPLQYFRRFITDEMIESIVTFTNQYSIQKTGTCVNTTVKEIEQVIELVLRMGIVQMPGIRVYFEDDTRYGPVADVIGRNRFQLILRTLHFVDNEAIPDEDKSDKLWKIRPFLDKFRAQCLLVIPEEKQSIDEMMIPFKGRFSQIKQYLRGKPNPWGFKVWCRCSTDGMLHDFEVYQGKTGNKGEKSSLGVAGEVVRKLSGTLSQQKNYKVYADNRFTSVALMEEMQKNGFQYTGTVCVNRLSGCDLQNEKELAKSGRGSFDYRVELDTNIVCVRWLDTKMVTLMSTCAGVLPLDTRYRQTVGQERKRTQGCQQAFHHQGV